jgi:hypothetical protein
MQIIIDACEHPKVGQDHQEATLICRGRAARTDTKRHRIEMLSALYRPMVTYRIRYNTRQEQTHREQ